MRAVPRFPDRNVLKLASIWLYLVLAQAFRNVSSIASAAGRGLPACLADRARLALVRLRCNRRFQVSMDGSLGVWLCRSTYVRLYGASRNLMLDQSHYRALTHTERPGPIGVRVALALQPLINCLRFGFGWYTAAAAWWLMVNVSVSPEKVAPLPLRTVGNQVTDSIRSADEGPGGGGGGGCTHGAISASRSLWRTLLQQWP